MNKKPVLIIGGLIVCVAIGIFINRQKSLAALNMKDAIRINRAIGALYLDDGQIPTEAHAVQVTTDLIQRGEIEGSIVSGEPRNRTGRPFRFTIVDFGAPGKPMVEITTRNEGMWGMFAYASASEVFEYPQQEAGGYRR